MKIYLGADHRGFTLKEKIKTWLTKWGKEWQDLGAYKFDPNDDYPLYAEKVGSIVSKEKNARGILSCGSGVGADISVNKIDGVRASIGKSKEQVKAGRNDDDMNVLVLAADYTKDKEAKEMIKVFLATPFARKEKYKRRLFQIKKQEANN